MQSQFQFMFKYIIIGDTCVGKSCLLLQFLQNKFKFDHDSTIGVQFGSKIVNVKGTPLKLQIWDTAGQETFKSITRSYYRGSIGVILSFQNVESWLRDTKNFANDRVSIMLVGNKTDLQEKRCISYNQGQDLASDEGIMFIQASAKTGDNVQQIFTGLAQSVMKKIDSKQIDVANDTLGVKLSDSAAQKLRIRGGYNNKRGYCC